MELFTIVETVTRTLTNGETLTVTAAPSTDGCIYYKAKVSSDVYNAGFTGDFGKILDGENLEDIATEIELWCNDNLNS